MAERLVFAVFFTAITVACLMSKVPEVCAAGIVFGCIALCCWIHVARFIDGNRS